MDGGANSSKLKSDEDEDQRVQDKIQRFPDSVRLDANRRRKKVIAAAGEEQSARDNRQYARGLNFLGREIDSIRSQNAERDLNRPIVDVALDAGDQQGGEQTQSNAASREPGQGEDAARHCGCLFVDQNNYAELKGKQAGCV